MSFKISDVVSFPLNYRKCPERFHYSCQYSVSVEVQPKLLPQFWSHWRQTRLHRAATASQRQSNVVVPTLGETSLHVSFEMVLQRKGQYHKVIPSICVFISIERKRRGD